MPAEPTYTFFLRGFETLSPEPRLILNHAFNRVVDCSGYHAIFDDEAEQVTLVLSPRGDDGDEITIVATEKVETDAEREVMRLAMDGRLNGFTAVPDEEFQAMVKARHAT